jgi:tetratricopeptide (TPR) repeat protein
VTAWRRLQEIFLEARALSEEEIAGLLEERCAGNIELLEQLRSLLRADREPGPLDAPPPLLGWALEEDDLPLPDRVGPYVLGGEIGRGGMAIVARAHDPRLQREVALKIISGETRALGGGERFIAEARSAAKLDHPNICTIYDVGSLDDGRLYMAMPYYRRGTLADRLRLGPLPAREAGEIALAVAGALAAAHGAGMVHRDVKPANIAFGEDDEPKLLDFGIALLGDDAAGGGRMAGTPAYMAPEQGRGDPVDGRTDVWALGAVLFEMLTGQRLGSLMAESGIRGMPYEDELDRARVIEALGPESPHELQGLADVVALALRREPAERFQSAAELRAALSECLAAEPRERTRSGRSAGGTAGVLGLAAVAVLTVLLWPRDPGAGTPAAGADPSVVAVVPFRVSADSALAYLREGMVDLLAARLTGEGGLRAADPRTVLRAWQRGSGGGMEAGTDEAAVGAARAVGAGLALMGEVVGTSAGLLIQAAVLDGAGRIVGRASAEGPHEDLSHLIDELVAEILSTTAGEPSQRLPSLVSTPLPALRAFLEGQADYRRGRYEEAILHYTHALEYDSTFALAGLGLASAAVWTSGAAYARERGETVAWSFREELTPRDRALLVALVGPGYPGSSSVQDVLSAVEEALVSYPDRAELWYQLGDLQFHFGRAVGRSDWDSRAERALARALQLDSAFAPASHHLVALYARSGNDAALRRTAELYLAASPTGATADYIRWRVAAGRGRASSGSLDRSSGMDLEGLDPEALGWIAMHTQDDGFAVEEGLRAAQLLAARPGTNLEERDRRFASFASLLNVGRPTAARAALAQIEGIGADLTFTARLAVLAALYGDGSSGMAESAAVVLERRADATPLDRCVAGLWQLRRGAPVDPPRALPPVAPAANRDVSLTICQAVRAAEVEWRTWGRPGPAAQALDDLLLRGPSRGPLTDGHTDYAAVALAGILEESGDAAGALAVLRRRYYFIGWQPYLAASLRSELRLATATADTAGARAAAIHLLALRSDPATELGDDADVARSVLAAAGGSAPR